LCKEERGEVSFVARTGGRTSKWYSSSKTVGKKGMCNKKQNPGGKRKRRTECNRGKGSKVTREGRR
jgi:hypothetical protein